MTNSNLNIDGKMIDLILNDKIDKKLFLEILNSKNINSLKDIHEYLLDIFLNYVENIVDDHFISQDEIMKATKLKLFFEIKEGDFYEKRHLQIKHIIQKQYYYFLVDRHISHSEELQEVNLQDLFDLGFDQYLELSK